MQVSVELAATGERLVIPIGADDTVADVKHRSVEAFGSDPTTDPTDPTAEPCHGRTLLAWKDGEPLGDDSTPLSALQLQQGDDLVLHLLPALPQEYHGHDACITTVGVSPCGTRLYTGSHDQTAKVWLRETGECLATLEHEDAVDEVLVDPTGERLYTRSQYHSIRVWQTGSWELEMELKGGWCAMALPHCGSRLFTGLACGRGVRVWQVGPWVCERSIDASAAFNLASSPSGDRLFCGQQRAQWGEGRLQMISAEGGQVQRTSPCASRGAVMSPCGERLFVLPSTCAQDTPPCIHIYSADTLKPVGEIFCSYLPGMDASGLNCLALSPTGTMLYVNDGGGVSVYDTTSLQCIGRLTREPVSCIAAWGSYVFYGYGSTLCAVPADSYEEIRYPKRTAAMTTVRVKRKGHAMRSGSRKKKLAALKKPQAFCEDRGQRWPPSGSNAQQCCLVS